MTTRTARRAARPVMPIALRITGAVVLAGSAMTMPAPVTGASSALVSVTGGSVATTRLSVVDRTGPWVAVPWLRGPVPRGVVHLEDATGGCWAWALEVSVRSNVPWAVGLDEQALGGDLRVIGGPPSSPADCAAGHEDAAAVLSGGPTAGSSVVLWLALVPGPGRSLIAARVTPVLTTG